MEHTMKDPITKSDAARSGLLATVVLLVGLSFLFPSEARADGWVSGFFGRAFGGETGVDLGEALKDRYLWTYGFNAGGMGGGVIGAEFDFGYTPNFFGSKGIVDKSGVMTVMGSLIAGIPVGGQSGAGIRPYGVFGVGLIRRRVEFSGALDNISSSDFGYNVGGGIMGFFNQTVGIRGEYRYFWAFTSSDEQDFKFSRASLGIVLRF